MKEAKQAKLLSVRDLSVAFETDGETVVAVDRLSFDLEEGEILGIVGESGSGKSVTGMSLLRLIPQRIGRISNGSAEFKGRDLLSMPIRELIALRGREIGIIFQEPMTALSPLMPVGAQFVETLRLHFDIGKEAARRRAVDWLDKVGIPDPEERMASYPYEFSGGMRQRVMIAMVLMLEPSLIIADEPTTALDVTTQRQIFELILDVRSERSSILFVTHDMGVIWQLCDRVMVMEKARKVEEGPLRKVFDSPQEAYTKALLSAVPRLSDSPRRMDGSQGETLLKVAELKTWFPVRKGVFSRVVDHVRAVDGVSFEVREGETLALVGESGSGKSTIGRTILGLERARSGSIRYRGKELLGLGDREFLPLRRNLQIVFQDPFSSLNPRHTVLDILTEGLERHGLLAGRGKADEAARLMEEVGLKADQIYRYPHEFSGGQRQRICIARAISLEPEFVILDEAVSALDVTIQAQVLDLLMDLQERLKLSYLFISHDLSVVKRISDRVIVLRRGAVVEQGDAQTVIGNPRHEYTRALLDAVPTPGDESCRLAT